MREFVLFIQGNSLFQSSLGLWCFGYNAQAVSSMCACTPFVKGTWFPLIKGTFFKEAASLLTQVSCGGRKFLCSLCSSSMWFWGGSPMHALKGKERDAVTEEIQTPHSWKAESFCSFLNTEIRVTHSPHNVLNGGPLAEKGIDNWGAWWDKRGLAEEGEQW